MCGPRPGPNIVFRVEFMARHAPSQAENKISEDIETLSVPFPCINSHSDFPVFPVCALRCLGSVCMRET